MEFHPLTPARWPDFEKLFGPSGAYAGCWCMWWRTSRSQFEKQANRLMTEGVTVSAGRIDMLKYRWQPDLDELLWKPTSAWDES